MLDTFQFDMRVCGFCVLICLSSTLIEKFVLLIGISDFGSISFVNYELKFQFLVLVL